MTIFFQTQPFIIKLHLLTPCRKHIKYQMRGVLTCDLRDVDSVPYPVTDYLCDF